MKDPVLSDPFNVSHLSSRTFVVSKEWANCFPARRIVQITLPLLEEKTNDWYND